MPLPSFVVNTQALIVRDNRYLMIVRGEHEEQAPGVLAPPGGKVEHGDEGAGILEETLRREILEETGVTVGEMAYIRSSQFTLDTGESVIDVAFLCQFKSGEAHVADPDEVAAVLWLTVDEIDSNDKTPQWTRTVVVVAEAKRKTLAW